MSRGNGGGDACCVGAAVGVVVVAAALVLVLVLVDAVARACQLAFQLRPDARLTFSVTLRASAVAAVIRTLENHIPD